MSEDLPRTVGPYRLEELLGKGGMGEVYKAYDQRLDRRVAIKHIRPEAADKPRSRERFRREAWMAARLSHPALVQIFDVLEERDGDWIVMELIDGPSLAEKLRDGPLAIDEILAYGRRLADALAEAHDQGIVHRDLKAENVMLTASGRAKLLDFGLAKPLFAGELDVSISARGEIKGTVRSMSPEQARGLEIDPRSDLFSLGTLLYEMATAESPFLGETALDTLARVSTHRQRPARELNPAVSQELSDFIDLLLEKAPELRPASAREAADHLARIAEWHARPNSAPAEDAAAGPLFDQETAVRPVTSRSDAGKAVIRTLLVTDLVDSTALFARLGDRRAAQVCERHDELARGHLSAHGGREIDKSDGFLLLFERPVDAVAYALAYHRALADLSRELQVVLQARAGIHVGEVFLRENPPAAVARGAKPLEVEGLAKATAARVMSLALGRQTLLTHGAFDLARRGAVGEIEDQDLRWLDHGAYSLKGVDEPVDVYEVGIVGFSPLINPVDRTKAVRIAEPRLVPSAGGSGSAALAAPNALPSRLWWRVAALAVLAAVVIAVLWVVAARRGLGGGPFVAFFEAPAHEPYELYQRGIAYLKRFDKKDNIDQAIEVFQRLLALEPDSAPGHAGLAKAYWLKHYSESKDPQWADQARAVARRAVDLDGHLAAARVSLGLAYASLGRLEEAQRELDQALLLDPTNADATWGLARLYESQGRLEEAEALYREAIELDPEDRFVHDLLGSLYFRLGRYQESEASFRRSIELAPDGVYGYRNLAGVYLIQGRDSEAAALLQEALEIRPTPSLYSNLGTIFFTQGLYQQSAAAYEKAIEILGGSNDYRLWGNLGDAYRWTPDNEEEAHRAYRRAVQLLTKKLERQPDDLALRSRLALLQAKKGDHEVALRSAVTVSALTPRDSSILYRLAVAYEVCGRRGSALDALGRALRAGYSTSDSERDPELRDLRADPRYHRMISELETAAGR